MSNKETQKLSFNCGSTPNATDFSTLIDSNIGVLTNVVQLPIASSITLNTIYKIDDNFYQCVRNNDGTFNWKVSSSTGGVTSYLDLTNRPRINGTVLSGDLTPRQLGILADNGGYDVTRPENNDFIYIVRGRTPLVCRVSDLVSSGVIQDVETLVNITGTPPVLTGMIIGDTRYFNTIDKLIYLADSTTTWNPLGRVAIQGNLYINKADNVSYRYEDGEMIELGGGGGGSISTITVGSTTTGVAGTEANVINTGTNTNAVLEFTIPRGLTGERGLTGNPGANGIGIPDGGEPGDILIINDSGESQWLKGRLSYNTDDFGNKIDLTEYAQKIIISVSSPDDLILRIDELILDNQQDMNIIVRNNSGNDIIAYIEGYDGLIEWKDDGEPYITIQNERTAEISLSGFINIYTDRLVVRGIKG